MSGKIFGGKPVAPAPVKEAAPKEPAKKSSKIEAGLEPQVAEAKKAKAAKDYSSHPKFQKFNKEG